MCALYIHKYVIYIGEHKSKGSHGHDGGRTKRYSSQRQRNPEQGDNQQFYQDPPKGKGDK